jgi:hypothetical protein
MHCKHELLLCAYESFLRHGEAEEKSRLAVPQFLLVRSVGDVGEHMGLAELDFRGRYREALHEL